MMLTNFRSDWLTIDNLGQFNLITGRNGVGKTRLLKGVFNQRKKNNNFYAALWHSSVSTESITGVISLSTVNALAAIIFENAEFNLHYTSMKPMWEQLLGNAYEQSIQVFATTHSMECVRAFSEVATAYKYDVRLINIRDTVARGKEVLQYNTNELQEMVNDGLELT